ncbi:biotin--[acetyl-CoA-carboxylase] ligase [Hyphococcus luteus]|uniref:biotin--[biotin carboxyl-carrier protein] ligase n=1 Tax=Hyphococcus luteus TaxID=2058213 RepID=A0A2S7KAF3_9PROT|nr:biotin--[acetyl-CoA-carboxylase] ligase [Marinicaulis flavus]PQA89461.1 biotin--[acetyl-CoA-carboxylase] ligase [Marinicaulis flavus]
MAKFPSGTAIEIFDTLDSTSAEARRRAEAGEAGPLWVLALAQTAGYGRRGRGWEQQTGDFACTLLFKPDALPASWGQISFIVALALASVLDELMPEEKIALKWPNDVLLDGAKCAGILLESLGAALSIGVGVNIVTAPEGLPYPVARLMDHAAQPPAPQKLAERLDHHFWTFYRLWRAQGFAPIRDAWLARAVGLGVDITVRLPNEELSGVFEGLDETGALVLRSPAGRRTIAAGDVFFARRGN